MTTAPLLGKTEPRIPNQATVLKMDRQAKRSAAAFRVPFDTPAGAVADLVLVQRFSKTDSYRPQGKWALCPRHIVGLGACGEEPSFRQEAEPTTFRSQYSNPLLIRYTGRPEASSGIRRITMNTQKRHPAACTRRSRPLRRSCEPPVRINSIGLSHLHA